MFITRLSLVDKLLTQARMRQALDMAASALCGHRIAQKWLLTPNSELDGLRPIQLLNTDAGLGRVNAALRLIA